MPILTVSPPDLLPSADLHAPGSLDHYREHLPHPLLKNRVRTYWSMEELHTRQTEKHRFYPERMVRLCFYQGEAYLPDLSPGASLEPLPSVYMLGFQKEPMHFISRGLTRVVGVELYPWAARELMQPGEHLQNIFFQPVQGALRALAREVLHLIGCNDIPGAIEAIETWLLSRLSLRDLDAQAGIQAALSLYHLRGQARVSELADWHGVSVRHLERQFQDTVGITPKLLSRLIRFEEAHNQLWVNPQSSLTELAFELGYADQAHFCREFRTFTHITPSEFSRQVQVRQQEIEGMPQHHQIGMMT